MATYSEKWCMAMDVLVKARVKYPDPLTIEEEVINCIGESTDPEISSVPWDVASKIAVMPPWTIDFSRITPASSNSTQFKPKKHTKVRREKRKGARDNVSAQLQIASMLYMQEQPF